jgi:hypothetical protein
MHIWDVEDFKKRITRRQLRRWLAFYMLEPWGQPWRIAGRMTSMIRAAFVGKFDRHEEERFLVTYRQGDEFRPTHEMSDDEVAGGLAMIPGLRKKEKKQWRSSAKSPRSSRRTPPGSSPG